MEHLLIYLIHFIVWLDRYWQKPIRKVIPDLDALLEQPEQMLSREELVIGPFRRWASAVTLGLALTAGLSVLWYVWFLYLQGLQWGARLTQGQFLALWLVILILAVTIIYLLQHWLRGGEMVLRAEGVELRYRSTRVICPWALFNSHGNPFQPSEDRLLVPVNARVVPNVDAYQNEMLREQGMKIRTKPLRFKSLNLAMMRSLYEVQISDLGKLLIRLGRQIAGPTEEKAPPVQETTEEEKPRPAIARKSDGWLVASLTHLTFPPFCCDCGTQTIEKREFMTSSMFGETAQLEVPFCGDCQHRFERRQRRAVGRGVILGVGVALGLVVLLTMLTGPMWPVAVALTIPLGMMGLVMGAVYGQQIGQRRLRPMMTRDYSPSDGLVTLRFRNPAYNEALIAMIQENAEEDKQLPLSPAS